MNTKQFTLRLAEKQLNKVVAIAKAEKRTVSAVIRNLIDDKEHVKNRMSDLEKGEG